METCVYCGKAINVVVVDGQPHVDTKYWHEGANGRNYLCDAKCGLAAHQIGWTVLLGNKNG
jgi:hypothetical protein